MQDTNESNNLFLHEGWIVAKHEEGGIKIAWDVANETQNFNNTDYKWVILTSSKAGKCASSTSYDHKGAENRNSKADSKQYNNHFPDSYTMQREFFLIRDLLNCKPQNGLSKNFILYGTPFRKVMLCARITSIQDKGDFQRFIIDDGTSAILCIARKPSLETSVQEKVSTEIGLTNNQVLINALESRIKKLEMTYSTSVFDQTCLGLPVEIIAYMNEFKGKHFLFADYIRKIPEAFYMQFMKFILHIYESRAKDVLEKK
ncbi:uncharacterized protein [Euwallacea fornicatus]|uniref:uncharacterized protein n=1 Tax=Euwallacea fornicatus TaxID=995702 RepID=UPI00338DC96F